MEEFCDATQLILESESPWRDRAIDTELDRVNGDRGKKRRRRRRGRRKKKRKKKKKKRNANTEMSTRSGYARKPRARSRSR